MKIKKNTDYGTTNRSRKKESRNPRGAVRGEVPIPGTEIRNSRRKSDSVGNNSPRSARHDSTDVGKTQRSTNELGHRNNRNTNSSNRLASNKLRRKINKANAQVFLQNLAEEHLTTNLNTIVPIDDCNILAFSQYIIKQHRGRYQVYYREDLVLETSTSRVAIAWCVADKLKKYTLANELADADYSIERRLSEIEYYRRTLENETDLEKKYIVSDRLSYAIAKVKLLKDRLDKSINLAKYWQLKGFNDETSRLGIKDTGTTKSEST